MVEHIQAQEEKEVLGVVVISHGSLAKALIDASAMLMGDLENVVPVCLYEGADPMDYAKELDAAIDQFPQGVIVLVDLFGGTPSNSLIMRMRAKNALVKAISGVSLPMLIETLSLRRMMEGQELLNAIEEASHSSIVNITEQVRTLLNK